MISNLMRLNLKRSRRWITWMGIGSITLLTLNFLSGCNDKEDNAIAQAQACLNAVPQASPSNANACMAYVTNYSSQRALAMKCSISFFSGGLTETKVFNAYRALKDSPSNKEAIFIATLGLTPSAAQAASTYCNASQIKGYIYLAQLSVMGSSIASVIGGYDPLSGVAPTQTEIQNAITTCTGGGCDDTAIGNAAITLNSVYCSQPGASQDVCPKIQEAITAGGGSAAGVAQYLYGLL